MKFSKRDLAGLSNGHLVFHDEPSFDENDLKEYPRIRKVLSVKADGKGEYDVSDGHLYLNLKITGEIVVPCDVTWDDVILPYDIDEDVELVFGNSDDPDVYPVNSNVLDTDPVVLRLIYQDIPLKVVRDGILDYPKGDGWEVIREEDYVRSKENKTDPRMEKLKELNTKN